MNLDDHARSNAEANRRWDAKAEWWDALMGDDGNEFHRTVVGPPLEALLKLRPGETVLDVGCGNGHVARRLAALGGRVTATDQSERFLTLARERGVDGAGFAHPIDYTRVDATDEAALLSLGEGAWDAVVSTMALMDMATIQPFHRAVARLLRPGGRCVIAVAHPCFNSSHVGRIAEERDVDGQLTVQYAVRVDAYRNDSARLGMGAIGEPEAHVYFHRSIESLLAPALTAGLVIDGLLEPAFPPGREASRQHSWANLPEIPPVLVYRLRPSR